MSLEADAYFPPPMTDRERRERDAVIEDQIRPHHFDNHIQLVQRIFASPSQDYQTICLEQADAITKRIEQDFEHIYGTTLDDNSVPLHYREDVNGQDRDATTIKFAQAFAEFVTKPDDIVTAVGPFIDPICQGCAFGEGQGGFHCRTYDLETEELKTADIEKKTRSYLWNNTAQAINAENPGSLWVHAKQVVLPDYLRVRTEEEKRPVTQLKMPLGLYRNVVTEFAFRDRTDHVYFPTFPMLLDHKGITLPQH